jgi:hypothetical protein
MLFQQPTTGQRTARGTPTAVDRKADALPASEGVAITSGKSSPASSTSDSSTSSDSATENMSRSHTFRRPPRFGAKRPSLAHVDDEEEEEEEDDDDEPTFVSGQATGDRPQAVAPSIQRNQPPTAINRDNVPGHRNTPSTDGAGEVKLKDSTSTSGKGKGRVATVNTESSTGSLSSPGSNQKTHRTQHQAQHRRGLDALSPKHRAELRAVGSPRKSGTGGTQVESDGTPSMGSSFSDLDGEYLLASYNDN